MTLSAAPFAARAAAQSEVCGEDSGHTYARIGNFSEINNQRNSRINLLKRLITNVPL
jgi:hypothetical protein